MDSWRLYNGGSELFRGTKLNRGALPTSRFFSQNQRRIDVLYSQFRSYGIDQNAIPNWLLQFKPKDRELALKVLENVHYFDKGKIISAYKSIHRQVLALRGGDLSSVYFAPFGYAGTSAEMMAYWYKLANRETTPDLESRMIGISEIQSKLLGVSIARNPTVIFIDDISGSGDEAIDMWTGNLDPPRAGLQEVVPPDAAIFLAVPIAFSHAISRIGHVTRGRIQVLPWRIFPQRERVLSTQNTVFTPSEKQILDKYCVDTGSSKPYGHKGTSSLVVFEHNCPDNNISILWANTKWKGLFLRA